MNFVRFDLRDPLHPKRFFVSLYELPARNASQASLLA